MAKELIPEGNNRKDKSLTLIHSVQTAIQRFPSLFDLTLIHGVDRLVANTSSSFISQRPFQHLRHLLLIQFFLQKKIEQSGKKESGAHDFFLKLFSVHSSLCLALTASISLIDCFQRERLLVFFQTFVPGMQEIPHSFYSWIHPELSYFFCYLEFQKLRGKEFSSTAIRSLEKSLKEQITHSIQPHSHAVFWPTNEEDSYRILSSLHKEIASPQEIPHVTISFHKQNAGTLDFLVHLVYPKSSKSLPEQIKNLSNSISFFSHLFHLYKQPFPIEAWIFTLTIPAHLFQENGSINLLYARRFIGQYIELLVGPFRDCNGGLFEKQHSQFETLEMHFSKKIPYFSLFAKKVFYSLRPIEKRFSLPLCDAEILLNAISKLMREQSSFRIDRPASHMLIIKMQNPLSFHALAEWIEEPAYGQVTLSNFHYFYVLGATHEHLDKFESTFKLNQKAKHSTLRLAFQAGPLLSLNPHHISKERRGCTLSKLLYEGLVRLDGKGVPQLAGAKNYQILEKGRIYVLNLRHHFWSNGKIVTAFHYINSWQYALRDPYQTGFPELLFIIKNAQKFSNGCCLEDRLGAQALDAETLKIELEWADQNFLYKLAQPPFFPFFENLQEPKWFNGPYFLQKKEKDGLTLEKNPYFWNRERVSLKQINIQWKDQNPSKLYESFQEAKIDWFETQPYTRSLETNANLRKHAQLYVQKTNGFFLIYLNTQVFPLNSKWIRKALNLVIDRNHICEHLFPENKPFNSFFHNSLNSILVDSRSALNFFEKGLKELGLAQNDFPVLTLSHSNEAGRQELAEYLQKIWNEKLGIEIQLQKQKWNNLRSELDKGIFQMSLCIESQIFNDPLEFLTKFDAMKTSNFSKWMNSRYVEILHIAKQEIPKKQQKILQEAEKLLMEDVPYIPLCNHLIFNAHQPKLKGYIGDVSGSVDFHSAYFENQG